MLAFRLTCLLFLGMSFPLMAIPQASDLFSKAFLNDQPTWLRVKLQADTDGEIWKVSQAQLTYKTGTTGGVLNILDDVMRIQSLEVGTVPNFYDLVYQIPDEVLKLDEVDLTVSLTFSTNTGFSSLPVETTDLGVDLKSLRESYWTRFQGTRQQTVVTYSPGSYVTLDYNGVDVVAEMGVATNMGMVSASLDGAEGGETFDLFPSDLPATANVSSPPNTRYENFSVATGGGSNEDHQLKLTLLNEKNPASTGTGFAVTTFSITRYTGNTQRLHELEVTTDSPTVTLFSYPAPFDGNILLQQLGFSSNWQDSLPPIVSDNNQASDNVTSGTNSGNLIGDLLAGNVITEDINAEVNTTEEANLKPRRAQSSAQTYIVEINDGSRSTTKVSSQISSLSLPIYKADQVHEVVLHSVGPGGKVRSTQSFFQTGLSSPIPWPAGTSNLTHSSLQGINLSREDSSSTWQVALIESEVPDVYSQQQTVLVVQKPNQLEGLSFSISGVNSLTPLDGSARLKSGASTSFQVENGNHMVVDPLTGNRLESSAGGGGGGGCLLD